MKISRIHLGPAVYDTLQNFVHHGHHPTFELITSLLHASPGEAIVEIGCGTGILAEHFVAHGYQYWGIDVDPLRIEAARQRTPGAQFAVGDVACLDDAGLPRFRRAFIHGVLHHLDDGACRRLLDQLLSRAPEVAVVVIEPFYPMPWWSNPPGALFARMDAGRFVRTHDEWRGLFGSSVEHWATRSLWPRWPVPFIVTRLTGRVPTVVPGTMPSSL